VSLHDGSINVKEQSQYYFISGCLWLEFLHLEYSEMSSLHACWFPFWFKVAKPHLIVRHIPPQKSITLTLLSLQVFQQYQDSLLFVYVSVDIGTHWEHTLWYPISSRIAHTVLMLMVSSIDGEWSACLSLPTAFLTNAVFCRLVTVWACSSFGMSVIHCVIN
jgi:hypothetical protein